MLCCYHKRNTQIWHPKLFSTDKHLTLSVLGWLLSSVENFCKQFGSRSGLTICRSWSGSKLLDTLIVLAKEFLKKLILKNSADANKGMKNYPACKELMKWNWKTGSGEKKAMAKWNENERQEVGRRKQWQNEMKMKDRKWGGESNGKMCRLTRG